jgi:hypothetical protein
MRPRSIVPFLALAAALLATPSRAEIGAMDAVPAATLLLPYFAVDLNNSQGTTTIASISNTGEGPVIAHFTLWSDVGVPTLSWNAYLTGFDTLTLDLGALFRVGTIPSTPLAANVGSFSLATNPQTGVGPNTASCIGQLPLPALPPTLLDHIRRAHTGQPSPVVFSGLCAGRNLGDLVVRGYLTIDNVRSCVLGFPSDAGYFVDGGLGEALNDNVLVGDYAQVDPAAGYATSHTMLHLEASSSDPRTQVGDYTFYARSSGGADNREPLASTFWSRYRADSLVTGGTTFTYWRDVKRSVGAFSCSLAATGPAPFPLSNNQIVLFDEQENADLLETHPFSPALPGAVTPFSGAAGQVKLGSAVFPSAFPNGWTYLNLNTVVAGSTIPFEPLTQNWLGVSFESSGQFRFGHDAHPYAYVVDQQDLLLPICDGAPDPAACTNALEDPLFLDGFETGDVSRWAAAQGR